MKYILAMLFSCFSMDLAACTLNPKQIARELQVTDPKSVVARLWDGGTCEDTLLDGLATGKTDWLDLARALHPYTDAWSSESLEDSLGKAMERAPSRVLRLIKDNSFDEAICVSSAFDDSPQAMRTYQQMLKRVRPMFESFIGTSLEPEARRCLATLAIAPER